MAELKLCKMKKTILNLIKHSWNQLLVIIVSLFHAFRLIFFPEDISDFMIVAIGCLFLVYGFSIIINVISVHKTHELKENERGITIINECYKSNKECIHNCPGQCRESC